MVHIKKFICIKYSSTLKSILYSYQKFLKLIFLKYNIIYTFRNIPIKVKKKTLLKSPHVNKKAKENFKYILYSFKLIIFFNLNLLKLLKYNKPKNIYLKASFNT